MTSNTYLRLVLARLRQLRQEAGISQSELEEKLILGPGWIDRFERGDVALSLNMLLVLLHAIGQDFSSFIQDVPRGPETIEVERHIYATQNGEDLQIHFQYSKHNAVYEINNANTEQFEQTIKVLRDGLSRLEGANISNEETIKTDSVAQAFISAVETWPHANPSDLWWFLIYRAYCDPFNHPAQFARLDFAQSWKRTGGWALEEVLVRHYRPFLKEHGIELCIPSTEEKRHYLETVKISERLEPDKMDVLLIGEENDRKRFFGVVHVKASFAERRTDDVPMSKALVDAGYTSPLWTLDCKSQPSKNPINRGELGPTLGTKRDRRSAKRKDIEDDGYFSACFSYNLNTKPTPPSQEAKARIFVCNFNDPDDEFSRFIISSWHNFRVSE